MLKTRIAALVLVCLGAALVGICIGAFLANTSIPTTIIYKNALRIYFVFIVLLLVYLFVTRPLTEKEVKTLAREVRDLRIQRYYSFRSVEVKVNRDFKRKMRPDGAWYQFDIHLSRFPSIAAGLLKYKKHEWCIIALEKDRRVYRAWTNKGPDREQVLFGLTANEILSIANRTGAVTVLTFHNHPNPDPAHLNGTQASNQDTISAVRQGAILNAQGINLIPFVCERGKHYQYSLLISSSFMPLANIIKSIEEANDQSRIQNLSLRLSGSKRWLKTDTLRGTMS